MLRCATASQNARFKLKSISGYILIDRPRLCALDGLITRREVLRTRWRFSGGGEGGFCICSLPFDLRIECVNGFVRTVLRFVMIDFVLGFYFFLINFVSGKDLANLSLIKLCSCNNSVV